VNLIGNGVAVIAISCWEKEIDREKALRVLSLRAPFVGESTRAD
jgi:hypothetical protein